MFVLQDSPNQKLEVGVWAEYKGGQFLIAHAGNDKFQRVLARLQRPHRRKIQRDELDPVEQKRITLAAIAEAILLDWKDVTDADGNEIKYSVKIAVRALTNDPDFRDFVMEFSAEMENFREEELEEEGNSSAS